MVTFTDIKIGVHNGFCSCGEPFNPHTREQCIDTDQANVERAVIVHLIECGALKHLTVNDESNCTHTLSGCCWICGAVGDHGGFQCPTTLARIDIIERLDGRGFRE